VAARNVQEGGFLSLEMLVRLVCGVGGKLVLMLAQKASGRKSCCQASAASPLGTNDE
jgi:hypothetical protein